MLRRTLILWSVLVVAGAALTGCGGDGDSGGRAGDGGNGGSAKSLPLENTEWVLDQGASDLGTAARSVTVTARFVDGLLSGNSGCNSYSTSYEVDGSKLTIGAQIAGTRRACIGPASEVEAAYLAVLPTVRSYAIEGKALTLATSAKGNDLVYRGVDAAEALAGSWEVLNYFRPGAVVSPIPGTALTAKFADGTVSGDAGCNRFTGPYEAEGTMIRIGLLASTLRACADPAVEQQEADYLAALQLARTFSLDGGNLTLLREGGTIAVTFATANT